MHLRRSVLAGGSALAAVAALAVSGASAAGAGTHPTAVGPVATARAALGGLSVPGMQHTPSGSPSGIKGLTKHNSGNWAGYVDTGSGYSKVSASWTEPSVACGTSTTYAAFWVGIDGYSSGSVEQGGTLAQCVGGRAHYSSWWEHYPANAIQTVGFTVRPGDRIIASVTRSGITYTVKVTDSTHTSNSFTKTFTCSATNCRDTSVEWIAEAPSSGTHILPLAQFGNWTAAGDAVATTSKAGTISSFPDVELTMTSPRDVKAAPSALNSSGTSFGVTWHHST